MTRISKPPTSPKASRIHASLARAAPLTVAQSLDAIKQEEFAITLRAKSLKDIRYFCQMVEEITEVKVTSLHKMAMSDGYIITLTHGYTVTWLLNADKVRCKYGKVEKEIEASNLLASILHRHQKGK
jgi:hypothetical protein